MKYILKSIEEASVDGYKVVVFTGGEPTLKMENLLTGIEKATSFGLVTRVVTNAHWAHTDKVADRCVTNLVKAG